MIRTMLTIATSLSSLMSLMSLKSLKSFIETTPKSTLYNHKLIYSYILRIWSFIGCGHRIVASHISLLILMPLTATVCSSRL